MCKCGECCNADLAAGTTRNSIEEDLQNIDSMLKYTEILSRKFISIVSLHHLVTMQKLTSTFVMQD